MITRDKTLLDQSTSQPEVKGPTSVQQGWIGGLALIALGAVLLLAQLLSSVFSGVLILLALAVVFLVWGITTRKSGLLIPAGIFIGLSLGTWLMAMDWVVKDLSGEAKGGVFLLAFAAGWASITVLTALFTREIHWWPLIPGGIMAVMGGALLLSSDAAQAALWLNYTWPVVLIGIGIWLLIRRVSTTSRS